MNEIKINGKVLCVCFLIYSLFFLIKVSVASFDFQSKELSFQFHFLVLGLQLKMQLTIWPLGMTHSKQVKSMSRGTCVAQSVRRPTLGFH